MDSRDEALDRLLNELDPTDPGLPDGTNAIRVARLPAPEPGGKLRYILVGLAGLVGSVVCGSLGLTEPETTPRAVRGLLILFAFFGLGWTLLAAWVLARGRGNFAFERLVAARMAFGFTLVAVLALALSSSLLSRESQGGPMLATGLALLTLGAVVLIGARIEQAELSIREQVLRLECRIAALSDALSVPREIPSERA